MAEGKIRIHIKTAFGEIVVEGNSFQEIQRILEATPENFVNEIKRMSSEKLASPLETQLEGIVEQTTDGPVITARKKLTHYEAIGLLLYASQEKKSTAAKIARLLESTGIKAMVPARLNEMTKRGLIFKPNPSKPQCKLTMQGERWVEDEIIGKLKEAPEK